MNIRQRVYSTHMKMCFSSVAIMTHQQNFSIDWECFVKIKHAMKTVVIQN